MMRTPPNQGSSPPQTRSQTVTKETTTRHDQGQNYDENQGHEQQEQTQPITREERAFEKVRRGKIKLNGLIRRKVLQASELAIAILQVNDDFTELLQLSVPEDIMGNLERQVTNAVEKAFIRMQRTKPNIRSMHDLQRHRQQFQQEENERQASSRRARQAAEQLDISDPNPSVSGLQEPIVPVAQESHTAQPAAGNATTSSPIVELLGSEEPQPGPSSASGSATERSTESQDSGAQTPRQAQTRQTSPHTQPPQETAAQLPQQQQQTNHANGSNSRQASSAGSLYFESIRSQAWNQPNIQQTNSGRGTSARGRNQSQRGRGRGQTSRNSRNNGNPRQNGSRDFGRAGSEQFNAQNANQAGNNTSNNGWNNGNFQNGGNGFQWTPAGTSFNPAASPFGMPNGNAWTGPTNTNNGWQPFQSNSWASAAGMAGRQASLFSPIPQPTWSPMMTGWNGAQANTAFTNGSGTPQGAQTASTGPSASQPQSGFQAGNGNNGQMPDFSGGNGHNSPMTGNVPLQIFQQTDFGNMYNMPFPNNWKMPPIGSIPYNPRYMDPERIIEKGIIKPFLGTVEDYPRFQQSFYHMVHIQPSAIFIKIIALDRLVTDKTTSAFFGGLGTSPADYLLRIGLLEQYYGGEGRLQAQMIRNIKDTEGPVDKNLTGFRLFTQSVFGYLWNAPPHEADNPMLLDAIKDRLSYSLKVQYNQYLVTQGLPDNNRTVAQFLQLRLACEDRAREGEKGGKPKKNTSATHVRTQQGAHIAPEDTGPDQKGATDQWEAEQFTNIQRRAKDSRNSTNCICCQETSHHVQNCEQFYLMLPLDRRAFAARHSLCYICMDKGHRSRGCPNNKERCAICGFQHHLLLHPPSNAGQINLHEEGGEDDDDNASIASAQQLSLGFQHTQKGTESSRMEVSLTYCTVILRNPETRKEVKVNMLADTGANTSCIDLDLAKELELNGPEHAYHVQVGGGKVHVYQAFQTTAEIQGIQPRAKAFGLTLQVYKQPCGRLERVDWSKAKQGWSHLKDLELPEAAKGQVQGIIGTNDFFLVAPTSPAISQGRKDPVAFNTRLGWLVGGQIEPKAIQVNQVHAVLTLRETEQCCQEVKRALDRMWVAEHRPTAAEIRNWQPQQQLTPSEQEAEDIFQRTRLRQEDGRYQVGLLWETPRLPPSQFPGGIGRLLPTRTTDESKSRNAHTICKNNK